MLCVGLILVASFSLGSTFKVAENVVFEKIQDISAVQSKWMFSFFTDLKSYQRYMERLQNDLQRSGEIVAQTIERHRGNQNSANSHYLDLYERQSKEIVSLRAMYRVPLQELRDIILIQHSPSKSNKVKRALLPIVGKGIGSLFGIATRSDVRKVNRHINVLMERQGDIIHVLNDTLTILNVTQVEVRQNRHAIKTLSTVIQSVDERLTRFPGFLQSYLRDFENFMLLYMQVDLMITEMREAVEKGMFYMDTVKMQITQMSLGHLAPTAISPRDLKRILGIEAQIPKQLSLPAPIKDVWYYYRTLTCVTLIQDHKFITLVNLPILEPNSLFEVYRIHNIPLPYARTGMTATYDLETTTIAVNTKRTDFMMLPAVDLAQCSNPTTKFCSLHSALYTLSESRLCVIALFKRDKTLISENCQTKVRINTMLPQAVYIPDGNWVIIASEPLIFTIICLDERTYTVETKPPTFNLQLAPTCEAFANGIVLPPFYHKQSNYGRLQQRESLLTLQNSTFDIWKPVNGVINNTDMASMTDMIPDLDDVEVIPIDTLVNRLDKLANPEALGTKFQFRDFV